MGYNVSIKSLIKIGDLLMPSIYMEANGKKISGIVLEAKKDKAKVYLNNGNIQWIDLEVLHDLFVIT